jgi:hypothetical protein
MYFGRKEGVIIDPPQVMHSPDVIKGRPNSATHADYAAVQDRLCGGSSKRRARRTSSERASFNFVF